MFDHAMFINYYEAEEKKVSLGVPHTQKVIAHERGWAKYFILNLLIRRETRLEGKQEPYL